MMKFVQVRNQQDRIWLTEGLAQLQEDLRRKSWSKALGSMAELDDIFKAALLITTEIKGLRGDQERWMQFTPAPRDATKQPALADPGSSSKAGSSSSGSPGSGKKQEEQVFWGFSDDEDVSISGLFGESDDEEAEATSGSSSPAKDKGKGKQVVGSSSPDVLRAPSMAPPPVSPPHEGRLEINQSEYERSIADFKMGRPNTLHKGLNAIPVASFPSKKNASGFAKAPADTYAINCTIIKPIGSKKLANATDIEYWDVDKSDDVKRIKVSPALRYLLIHGPASPQTNSKIYNDKYNEDWAMYYRLMMLGNHPSGLHNCAVDQKRFSEAESRAIAYANAQSGKGLKKRKQTGDRPGNLISLLGSRNKKPAKKQVRKQTGSGFGVPLGTFPSGNRSQSKTGKLASRRKQIGGYDVRVNSSFKSTIPGMKYNFSVDNAFARLKTLMAACENSNKSTRLYTEINEGLDYLVHKKALMKVEYGAALNRLAGVKNTSAGSIIMPDDSEYPD